MSNKLYTEEKIRQKLYLMGYFDDEQIEDFINDLTPIELPTDEEIELKSIEYSTDIDTKEFYKDCCWDFQNGAKWLRNKIGGNK